jgi:hypothetical protein
VPTLQAKAPPTTARAPTDSSGGQSGPSQTTTAAPISPSASPAHCSGAIRSSSSSAACTATKSGAVLASAAARLAPACSMPQKTAQ